MNDAITQFRAAIHNAGLTPPELIESDGKLHRFASNGKRSDDAGWYVLHDDAIPAGAFGDWRTGASETWRADIGRRLSPQEEAAHRARLGAIRREREAEDAQRKAETREKAAAIWQAARPAPDDHVYLLGKGVRAHGLRVHDGALVIPMRDDAELHSLQLIAGDGEKRFLSGGRVSGCYFPIGQPDSALCIAEGYATGATIHEATGGAVAVAFNAGNLLPVARALRAKFLDLRLIVCADDDAKTEGNPGLTKAREAAQAVGGLLAVPDFGANRPESATDFNDLHRHAGSEAVRACVERAAPVESGTVATATLSARPEPPPTATLTRGDAIMPEPVNWLWSGWLAAGKIHILGGQAGSGKTTLALGLAAALTSGGRWPDGSRAPHGDVCIWSGEDDPADTLVPRLRAMGADMTHVHFVSGLTEDGRPRIFDPALDIPALAATLRDLKTVRLLIVDPLVSAISGDSHKNAEVRRGLQPLADLAASLKVCLLGITHFSKGTQGREPIDRITGSLAFAAAARIVLVTAKDAEHDRRILCRAKSNIGSDDGGFAYDLRQGPVPGFPGIEASTVLWGGAITGNARDILAAAEAQPEDATAVSDAQDWLRDFLTEGPQPQREVKSAADAHCLSWATVRRAKDALDIESRKMGGKDGRKGAQWFWGLPEGQGAQKSQDAHLSVLSTLGPREHLGSDDAEVIDL